MPARPPRDDSAPTNLAALAFAAVLLLVGCTDAFAADLLVTDVRGPVTRAGAPQPIALFETLKPGARIAVPEGARVELLDAAAGTIQPVRGPATITLTPQGPRADAGTLEPVRQLDAALRRVKVTPQDLALGSLRMRGSDSRVLEGPEGFVSAAEARTFRWKGRVDLVRFELATQEGEVVHQGRVEGGRYALPDGVRLEAGRNYVWGVSGLNPADPPADWTEFAIRDGSEAPVASGASEWRLVAVSLRAAGLRRAAERAERRASAAS
jgi:hypothetical protein